MAGIYIRPRSQQDQFGTFAFMAPNYASGVLPDAQLIQNKVTGPIPAGSAAPKAGAPGSTKESLDPFSIQGTGYGGFFELSNGTIVPYKKPPQSNGSMLSSLSKANLDQSYKQYAAQVQNDTNLDSVTRNELSQMFLNETSDINSLLKTLSQAESGYGIFGVRKINEAQKTMMAMYPGRSQVNTAPTGRFA